MPPTSSNRATALSSPLGADKLLLKRLTGTERLGRLFHYDLELLSDDEAIDFATIVGQSVTASIETADGSKRFINGIVTRFEYAGRSADRLTAYRATIRPWFWILTRRADCRIFQEKSITDIVKEVFDEAGFSDYEVNVQRSLFPRTYCVQYRETDFNFVSRLLEEEGLYYYFRHEDGKHVMVICDETSSHQPIPGYAEIPYRITSPGEVADQHVSSWSVAQRVQPGAYAVAGFNFETPRANMLAATNVAGDHAEADHEIYDYPEPHLDSGGAQVYAKLRAEEQMAEQEVGTGTTNARGMATGFTFDLTTPPRDDQAKKHLVIATHIEILGDVFATGEDDVVGDPFHCRFETIDATAKWRAARVTPRPVVQGVQTAMVVGKAGEEIWTDKYGRIKVQFHWERNGKKNETSSCWIRVAQTWASKSWGTFVLPRIGQEVVVSFLEGDPDCPLVTGCVYNGDNPTPYPLPGAATKTVFKSNSSKGGGGFNELTFEDKKGSELIFVHGQKDMDMKILHDQTRSIGNDRTSKIGRDDKMTIERDRTEEVKRHETIKIGGDRKETVDGNETIEIGKDRKEDVKGNETISISKDRKVTVTGEEKITISKSQTVSVTQKITVTAGQEIVFKCGAASLTMKADGTIQLKGVQVTVEGAATLTAKSGGQTKVEGMMTQVKGVMLDLKGDGLATLKGGITMIG
ncbi:MAG: type VI secretion system tip protein VgrG [Planctomycetes bacterium]|nr:type VI secretion system tip protein VgrG [Planctomycetota bacterium]